MNFSKLRHRVTLLRPSGAVKNSMNEDVPSYVPVKTVWACVQPMTGKEYAEAQKIRAETTYKIAMRHFPGLLPDMRLEYKGRRFDIISVLNLGEKNEEMQLVAVEAVN